MTSKVPMAFPAETIANIQARLHHGLHTYETINYLYVVQPRTKTLIGVLSIKEIYRHGDKVRIGDICKTQSLLTVKPQTHQERVVYLALRKGLRAIPVVSNDHVFLGAIPGDTILRILYTETHEDLARLAGVPGHNPFDNVLTLSVWKSLRHRIPWLVLGLLGGLCTAGVVDSFENIIRQNLILAAFIPLIVYMSDAVGTQMEAFLIRDLAMDRHLPFFRYMFRQLLIVALIAGIVGGLLFGGATVFGISIYMAAVLSLSLAAAVCSSVFTGLIVPYVFSRLRMDPANASGPIATIIQDLLSIVIYFSIATALL